MTSFIQRLGLCGIVAAAATLAQVTHAQSLDQLKGMVQGAGKSEGSGGSGALGGMGLPSTSSLPGLSALNSSSTGNVAGLIQFCIKNNYLGGGASSVKDKLMGKLGGGEPAEKNTDFLSGAKGLLKGGDGQTMDLSGGGLKEQVTKQVCDKVLEHAKSMI